MNIPYLNFNNDHLLQNCFSYLNCGDLSRTCQVSKTFNKISRVFNNYWREFCNDRFCSPYSHYSILTPPSSCYEDEMYGPKSSFDWKGFFNSGLQVEHSWTLLIKTVNFPFVPEELSEVQNEVYGTLKEHFSLPKLRRENHHLENNINTTFQIHLFDFLYEEQDLYEYYGDSVRSQLSCNEDSPIFVKRSDLPFTSSLENLSEMSKDTAEQKDIDHLINIRWYRVNNCFLDFDK